MPKFVAFWSNNGQRAVTRLKSHAAIDPSATLTAAQRGKGDDYKREQVVGRAIVEALGDEIVLIDLAPGHSTSSMVERTRNGRK